VYNIRRFRCENGSGKIGSLAYLSKPSATQDRSVLIEEASKRFVRRCFMARIIACISLCLAIAALLFLVTPAAQAAKNSEQIVFSGTGSFPGVTPFGFWIWCEGDSGNPYQGECNGAMYFYALGITKHVAGMVTETGEDTYQMNVVSTLDDSVACTLTNSAPIAHGPHNTVTADCTAPMAVVGITGTSTNAVVNVTGP
jgi:hypothetical protein